ncbi:Ca2+-binding RTX toxin-like protein [Actinoplanes campanulatus]|uniref:Ca2+-binding RTX toxin-like protein n=1 Tax=Actinoplanes campanulatus TaxID=113559 RepID=A0A7W5ALG7_9ACTN|nr:calcium-binding protein [Actinoplanes campanulatus]MBB3098325.1 Ca2+-binding RTX toxin-like protein [Actinoplanes campanulatus]GGN34354.1 hypothetical protein GCM10010109_57300 [Actinoplanes campanulatus]GID38716.1 hypothetical protein Aca09nite_52220 [Actinoplanes campanulatus]
MSRLTWAVRAGVALLGTTATIAMGAGPAQAASAGVASVSGSKLVYQAGSGLANQVLVTESGGTVTIDDKYKIKAGKGCTAVPGDKTKVTCTGAKYASIRLGSKNDILVNKSGLIVYAFGSTGNDYFVGGAGKDYLHGGSGNDTIFGADGNDWLYGESGNDNVNGGDGADRLDDGSGNDRSNGGSGNDTLLESAGKDKLYGSAGDDHLSASGRTEADYFSGGDGTDVVDYFGAKKPVTADADGVGGDDGIKGGKDTISSDVENLSGGSANDTLIGSAGANVLRGGGGNDRLYGQGGDDALFGESGHDVLNGGAGNDTLTGDDSVHHDTEKLYGDVLVGGTGVDLANYHGYWEPVTVDLDGRSGDDGVKGEHDSVGADVENLTGGYGSDTLTGNAANNVIIGGDDSADTIQGGAGDDRLIAGSEPGTTADGGRDALDGGTHVSGDACSYNADEDTAINCES